MISNVKIIVMEVINYKNFVLVINIVKIVGNFVKEITVIFIKSEAINFVLNEKVIFIVVKVNIDYQVLKIKN